MTGPSSLNHQSHKTNIENQDVNADSNNNNNAISETLINNKTTTIKTYYDQVNVRLPSELNDWLNTIVRQTKRLHGSKIPKELIIETLLRFLKDLEINWTEVKEEEDLLKILLEITNKSN